MYTDMPHRGIYAPSFPALDAAIRTILDHLYRGRPPPDMPSPNRTRSKHKRNEEIRARYEAGETLEQLAKVYGMSFQRIQQIAKASGK